jgi:hypothetical protein
MITCAMKMKITSILIILFISLLALTACGGLLPSIPTPSQIAPGLVYTLAAQTLAVEFTRTVESQEESLPSATAEQPTVTSEATPTLTFTPITPTETLTLTQSPTAIASPTLAASDPKKDLGSPDWRASFEDGSDWYLFEDDQVRLEVEDGNLKLTALKANNLESWSMSWPRLEDFYFEITTTTGEICGGKDRYGVIVRAPDPKRLLIGDQL